MRRKTSGPGSKCIYKLKLVVWRSDLHQFSVDENVYALHHSTPAVELHPYRPENKTISDGGITVDFWIIKVHTSN